MLTVYFWCEQCPTGPLWPCNTTGLRYSAVRQSLSYVRSREEQTLIGSMNGGQQAQTHLQHTVNTGLAVFLFPTVETTGVRVEETCFPQQSGVMPSHWQYHVSQIVFHSFCFFLCVFSLFFINRKPNFFSQKWTADKPRPTVMTNRRTIPVGRSVKLICSMEDSAGWKYYWFRSTSVFSESQIIRDSEPDKVISISQGGIYHCKGGRGNPVFFTEDSDAVTIEKRGECECFSLEQN